MAHPFRLNVRGLQELDRAFGRVDKRLRRGLRDTLRDAAQDVALEARSIAESKGLRESGDMIRGIRPFALAGRAGVRSEAVHRGFAYPRRLEFADRGGATYGPRASLLPAVKLKRGETERRVSRLVDDLVDTFAGFHGL